MQLLRTLLYSQCSNRPKFDAYVLVPLPTPAESQCTFPYHFHPIWKNGKKYLHLSQVLTAYSLQVPRNPQTLAPIVPASRQCDLRKW